jgi:SpoVK/Ycf46/Vps4 family AAA+-type ATPase
MVFSGNPGTGKTTVARIIAGMFASLGVLRRGQFVEVDRSMLVAGYAGQTAMKTKEVCEGALGGILFVDEAYSLVSGERDSFGREAIDTILKMMEDHRDDLVVIFAGYKKEMGTLMQSNSGLASRFPTWLDFEDYTSKELMQICQNMIGEAQMKFTAEAMELLLMAFEKMEASAREQLDNGGADDPAARPSNGRAVRNLIEQIQRKQAMRLSEQTRPKTMDDLTTIVEADVMPCVRPHF